MTKKSAADGFDLPLAAGLLGEPKFIIYKITNKKTKQAYIGLTSQGLRVRSMILMSIDPGLSGAVCFFGSGTILELLDIPTLPDGASNRQVDIMALCRRIDKHKPTHAIIENVQPMPSIPGANGIRRGMGAASSFRFGFAVGQARALVTCYGLEVRLVHPQSWKRWAGLKGPDKEQSRQKALVLMPSAARWLPLKKDHNKAEALILALYLTDTLGML